MNIIIFGPPGSGKGTQSNMLSSKYGLNIVATGDLLRATAVANNIDVEVRSAIESGVLVEDSFVCNIVYKRLKLLVNNFILDGFPRNLNQAKFLDRILKETNQVINYIIELQIDDDVMIERVASRFVCSNCGNIYNHNLKYLGQNNECKKCGSKEIKQRCDDKNLNIIKKRIREYRMRIEDLREYYKSKVLRIDADMDIAQVTEAICAFFF